MAAKRHEPNPLPQLNLIPIPKKFRPEKGDECTSEKYELAAYFLKWKGRIKKVPQYADCRVGFTPDMRRFVWKTLPRYRSDPLAHLGEKSALPPSTVLLYGDLEKEAVQEIPCPPELVEDNAIEIEWVVAQ